MGCGGVLASDSASASGSVVLASKQSGSVVLNSEGDAARPGRLLLVAVRTRKSSKADLISLCNNSSSCPRASSAAAERESMPIFRKVSARATLFSCGKRMTATVMLSVLPRVKARSFSFDAATLGSKSKRIALTAYRC